MLGSVNLAKNPWLGSLPVIVVKLLLLFSNMDTV